jgi:hypothetical protein
MGRDRKRVSGNKAEDVGADQKQQSGNNHFQERGGEGGDSENIGSSIAVIHERKEKIAV